MSFSISCFTRIADGAVAIKIETGGPFPSNKVRISITNNANNAGFAYQALYGPSMQAGSVDLGSNGRLGTSCDFSSMALPVYIFPQYGLPGDFKFYKEFWSVMGHPSDQMRLIVPGNPDANITISCQDAGSGGPPEA